MDGLYECVTMPFGLRNGPATFQRLMDTFLAGLKWTICIPYIDDILVFSKDFESHLEHLNLVLGRLRAANLTIKAKKCLFGIQRIEYLGYVISDAGIEPNKSKVEAVSKIPQPTNVDQVRSFIGMATYYRRFVKDFSKIAEPLTRLTRKDIAFEWKEEQQEAFEILKYNLINPPLLSYFDPKLFTEVRCDACDVGLGAVLVQKNDGAFNVVAYASRLTNKHEKNNPISELEALALVFALDKFRIYLAGIHFNLITDHCALCWMQTKINLAPRLT